jgi:hypothetical protein
VTCSRVNVTLIFNFTLRFTVNFGEPTLDSYSLWQAICRNTTCYKLPVVSYASNPGINILSFNAIFFLSNYGFVRRRENAKLFQTLDVICTCCCCWWSGHGAKAPVALQPLDLLYTLFSTSSHCRRQMYPRPMRRERSKQREVELNGRERVAENFADFHVTFRDLLHAANIQHGTAGFTSPAKEGVLGIFSPWKILRLRPGLNPRTWVLEANTHPLDHRSHWFVRVPIRISLAHLPWIMACLCVFCTLCHLNETSEHPQAHFIRDVFQIN